MDDLHPTSLSSDVIDGSEFTWPLAIETCMRIGDWSLLPEALTLHGREWTGLDNPEGLSVALGMPLAVVHPIIERLKASGIWTENCSLSGFGDLSESDSDSDSPSKNAWIDQLLELFVANGLIQVVDSEITLPPSCDARRLRPLTSQTNQGTIGLKALTKFLRADSPGIPNAERAKVVRKDLVASLFENGLLVRPQKERLVWTWSRKAKRVWKFKKVPEADRTNSQSTWIGGPCAPLRPRDALLEILREMDGFPLSHIAELWQTETRTVDQWFAEAKPTTPRAFEVGRGLRARDKRRPQVGLILASIESDVRVLWPDGTEREISRERLARYEPVAQIDPTTYRSRSTPDIQNGWSVEAADKRRPAKGEVLEVINGTRLIVRWENGRETTVDRRRFSRYSFSPPKLAAAAQ